MSDCTCIACQIAFAASEVDGRFLSGIYPACRHDSPDPVYLELIPCQEHRNSQLWDMTHCQWCLRRTARGYKRRYDADCDFKIVIADRNVRES